MAKNTFENIDVPQQCPFSHRIARRVSTAIIAILTVTLVALLLFLLRNGA